MGWAQRNDGGRRVKRNPLWLDLSGPTPQGLAHGGLRNGCTILVRPLQGRAMSPNPHPGLCGNKPLYPGLFISVPSGDHYPQQVALQAKRTRSLRKRVFRVIYLEVLSRKHCALGYWVERCPNSVVLAGLRTLCLCGIPALLCLARKIWHTVSSPVRCLHRMDYRQADRSQAVGNEAAP